MLAQNDIFFQFVGINVFVEFCAPKAKKKICLFSGSRFFMAIDWWRLRNLLFKRTMCINYSHGFRGKPTDIIFFLFIFFLFPLSISLPSFVLSWNARKKIIIQRFFRDWAVFLNRNASFVFDQLLPHQRLWWQFGDSWRWFLRSIFEYLSWSRLKL